MHTITTAAHALRQGTTTPEQLVGACLAQIAAHEEQVQAWVLLDAEGALAQAVRMQDEFARGLDRGPLHGIPIGIKDIVDVAGMPTAVGAKRWAKQVAHADSTVVARLRAAGAIILGKTVTTAYASFDPPPTRNPWKPDRTPGGSSSGSAAAVACGMCLAAIASQTGGSITRPAGYCGVVSLKPTYGNIQLDGVLPLAPSMDHLGVMTNAVADLTLIYTAVRNPDGETTPSTASTRSLRLPLGLYAEAMEPSMQLAFRELCARLTNAGWSITPTPLPASFADIPANQRLLMGVEAAAFHEARWRQNPDDYPPCVTSLMQEGMAVSAPALVRLQHHYRASRSEFDAWLGTSFLLTPATTGPAPAAATTGNPLFNAPWSYLGLPTVSLPFAWTDDGLPLSIQLVGARHCEAGLFALAQELESVIAFERRTVPMPVT